MGKLSNDPDRISVRDNLERDKQGKTRVEKKNEDRTRHQKGINKEKGKLKKYVFGFLLVIGLVMWGFSQEEGKMANFFRTWNSSPTENLTTLFNSMEQVDRVNKENVAAGEYKLRTLYDINRIYSDKYVTQMVDKEYVVYVYTEDKEKDNVFNEWVRENDHKVTIFRLNPIDIKTNHEIKSYLEPNTPMLLIYNEIERDVKVLDGVIKDTDLLEEVVPYIEELIEAKTVKTDETE